MGNSMLAALLVLLCTTAASAVSVYQRPINGDCIQTDGSSDTAVQLYPDQYLLVGDEETKDDFVTQVTSALGFTVTYYPTYKVVNNTIAGEVYVLYQCGAAEPAADQVPEGAKFFQVPLTSISAPETVPYAFLDFLGLGDRVHDVSPFVTSPCGQALLECPAGDGASPDVSNATLLEDTIGGSIDGMLVSKANPYDKTFALSASEDPGVLNRAEWVKFLGLFFNKEREASQVFDGIKAEYEATKAAANAASSGDKPVVAWASHFEYPGYGENYQLSFDPYQAQLVEDAGGAMLDRAALAKVQGVESDPTSPTLKYPWGTAGAFATQADAKAAFLDALKQADVIIDETYSFDPLNYTSATLESTWSLTPQEAATVPAFANQRVFREDGRLSYDPATQAYGMDWFEGAIARPGQVLRDMVRALQPQLATEAGNFTWIRNLFTEEPVVVGAQECDARAPCSAEPATICPFVKLCPNGEAPAILEGSADGTCAYAPCGEASALAPASAPAAEPTAATNTAAMAAPAIVLTLLVVAFVEMLMHFC